MNKRNYRNEDENDVFHDHQLNSRTYYPLLATSGYYIWSAIISDTL